MNIWYCHPYACSPLKGKRRPNRAYFLSDEWCKLGHKARVITSSFEHISGEQTNQTSAIEIAKQNNVQFAWLKTRRYQGNGLGRILNMLDYARGLRKQRKQLFQELGKPDVVICSAQHPFHFFACKKIAKETGAKLMVEIRDLWPLSLIELLGVSKFHPLCLVLSYIQKKMCQQTNVLISLLSHAKPYFVQQGLQPEKFHWIPNGYTPQESNDAMLKDVSMDPDYQQIKALKEKGHFIVGYTGAHGEPNCLRILVEASKLTGERVKFVLIGDGNIKRELVQQCDSHNVIFIDPKDKSHIKCYQALFSACYMGIERLDIYRYGISFNKMYEYMYNRCLIISGKYPEHSALHQANSALFFENDSIESLVSTIQRAVSLPEQERNEIKERAYKHVKQHFLYSTLAKEFEALFNN